jgi:alkaline phosphatase D
MFLDFMDVPNDSDRRRTLNGIEERVKLGEDVEVWLLDERWYRDPMPCEIRRDWCEDVVLPNPNHHKHGFCVDFVQEGGCCKADETIYNGVCNSMSKDEEFYGPACDHRHEDFGKVSHWQ